MRGGPACKLPDRVRGMCSLSPGLPKIWDRNRVISIIDRYLEHARIFYFTAAADLCTG
jgi:polyphosphate kinase